MTPNEFWNENPDLFWAYRFSYIQREKRKQKNINYTAWLHGLYVHEAVSVALSNAFSKKTIHYSKMPYGESDNKEQHVSSLQLQLKARVAQVQSVMKEKKNE